MLAFSRDRHGLKTAHGIDFLSVTGLISYR